MRYRRLGRTELEVSEVGFGAWAIGGDAYGNSYGPVDDNESRRAVAKAHDMGCNFFDTADVYGHGHSEEILGDVLKSVRDEVILATKVGGDFYSGKVRRNFEPSYIRFACEQSLRRLKTDYIELYQLHNPTMDLIANPDTYEVMDKLREEGKIRYYGVSIHPPEEGISAILTGKPDTIQVTYNIVIRSPEVELFSLAAKHNIGMIARETLFNGLLTGKYLEEHEFSPADIRASFPTNLRVQLIRLGAELKKIASEHGLTAAQIALGFVLQNPSVSVAIVGCKTEKQVEENMATSEWMTGG